MKLKAYEGSISCGRCKLLFYFFHIYVCFVDFSVTPLDVVKIRLQAQQKTVESSKCFLYCNGLMDHLCPCFSNNGTGNPPNPQPHLSPNWYERPGKFSGTLVCIFKNVSFYNFYL